MMERVYIIYIIISILLTIWVARTLFKNGRLFLVDTFKGNEALADSVNRLLVVGFYLINFGYISYALSESGNPVTLREGLELLSVKIGGILLILGFMHFFNLFVFANMRKKALKPAPVVTKI